MFVLTLTYRDGIEMAAVDAKAPEHMAWLQAGQAAGHIVAWGRKVPRDGGIVLVTGAPEGTDKASVEAYAASDPFIAGGIATVTVTEWVPSFAAPGLEGLMAGEGA